VRLLKRCYGCGEEWVIPPGVTVPTLKPWWCPRCVDAGVPKLMAEEDDHGD